jgi:hypothetical protein
MDYHQIDLKEEDKEKTAFRKKKMGTGRTKDFLFA